MSRSPALEHALKMMYGNRAQRRGATINGVANVAYQVGFHDGFTKGKSERQHKRWNTHAERRLSYTGFRLP